jgi:hypothetical protein
MEPSGLTNLRGGPNGGNATGGGVIGVVLFGLWSAALGAGGPRSAHTGRRNRAWVGTISSSTSKRRGRRSSRAGRHHRGRGPALVATTRRSSDTLTLSVLCQAASPGAFRGERLAHAHIRPPDQTGWYRFHHVRTRPWRITPGLTHVDRDRRPRIRPGGGKGEEYALGSLWYADGKRVPSSADADESDNAFRTYTRSAATARSTSPSSATGRQRRLGRTDVHDVPCTILRRRRADGGPEQCDDGTNTADGDGCDGRTARLPSCGDGIVLGARGIAGQTAMPVNGDCCSRGCRQVGGRRRNAAATGNRSTDQPAMPGRARVPPRRMRRRARTTTPCNGTRLVRRRLLLGPFGRSVRGRLNAAGTASGAGRWASWFCLPARSERARPCSADGNVCTSDVWQRPRRPARNPSAANGTAVVAMPPANGRLLPRRHMPARRRGTCDPWSRCATANGSLHTADGPHRGGHRRRAARPRQPEERRGSMPAATRISPWTWKVDGRHREGGLRDAAHLDELTVPCCVFDQDGPRRRTRAPAGGHVRHRRLLGREASTGFKYPRPAALTPDGILAARAPSATTSGQGKEQGARSKASGSQ